jgi:hypothetical protein
MRARLIVALTLLGAASTLSGSAPARAAEPSGCDKFNWPITQERAALTAPDRAMLASGAELSALTGVTLGLALPADVKLPSPPERKPKDGTFAGFVSFKAAHTAGAYTISVSDAAWIDVVQDDEILKPMAVSSATDCAGIRKTIKYDLSAGPLVIQVSGAAGKAVSMALLPSSE